VRIEDHPIKSFQRGQKVVFYFNGSPIEGYQGETIMAALHAAGIKALNKSKRHNRFRGLFCAIGKCSSCLMKVNGIENIAICVTKIQQDMVVESTLGEEL
jgi:sarcosine oxidase subunit alpha